MLDIGRLRQAHYNVDIHGKIVEISQISMFVTKTNLLNNERIFYERDLAHKYRNSFKSCTLH